MKKGLGIKTVLEVLTEEEHDPVVEIVRLLKGEIDPETGQRVHLLTADARAKYNSELTKFIHPQKKAVEVDHTHHLAGQELDNRLEYLLKAYVKSTGRQFQVVDAEVVEEAPESVPSLPPPVEVNPEDML